jgi:hypothetical protein
MIRLSFQDALLAAIKGLNMNEPMPIESGSAKASNTASPVRVKRILGLVVGIMVLVALVFAAAEYVNNQPFAYAKVTGRVMWNGKPITIGAVLTRHSSSPRETAVGALDSDGKFELITNGKPGAAIGLHKVIVASYKQEGMGIPLVPAPYLKAETTPLSIAVTSDPAKNHFELEVVGEMPERRAPGGPRGAGAGRPKAEASPQEVDSAPADQPTPEK